MKDVGSGFDQEGAGEWGELGDGAGGSEGGISSALKCLLLWRISMWGVWARESGENKKKIGGGGGLGGKGF